MLKTIYCYTVAGLYLIVTLPFLWRVKYLDKHDRIHERDSMTNRVVKNIAVFFFRSTGSTIKVTGADNIPKDQAVLIVSNHQGHMDNLIIVGFIDIPKGFVSIVSVLKYPIVSIWMKYINSIFIDRDNLRQTYACIEEGVRILKQGHSMTIFPEGKVSDCDTVGEFKKGCLKLAIKAGVPILPVTIKGSYKIMSKYGKGIKAAAVECIISKPVITAGLTKDEEKKLIDVVRDAIVKNIQD